MATSELDRVFLGTVLDNQAALGSAWALVNFANGGNQNRDGILFHVAASSTSSLDVNTNGTDVLAWYTITPGSTFFVPFPFGDSVYVRPTTAASTATYKCQEISL